MVPALSRDDSYQGLTLNLLRRGCHRTTNELGIAHDVSNTVPVANFVPIA